MQDDNTAVIGTGAVFQDVVNTVGAAGREFSKFIQPRSFCTRSNLHLAVGSCGCVVSND